MRDHDLEKNLEKNERIAMYVMLLLLASSFLFFSYVSRFGYGVLLPRIIEDMKLSRAEAGLAFSFYTFFYSLFSIISGRLFDKFGVKVVIILCVVHGVGMLLAGFSNNLLFLALSLVIAGLGASSSWTPMVALVSSRLPSSWRGRSTGALEIGIRASHGAVGLLLPPIALAMSWRTAWWIFSLPLFVYAIIFYLLLERRNKFKMDAERKELVSYKEVISSNRFWLVGSSYSLMAFASYIFLTFFVDFLEHEVGLSYVEASTMITIMGFMGIVGAILLSWISDRVGRRAILVVANGASSICFATFSILPSNKPLISALPLMMAVYGVLFGGLWPIYAACASDIFPSSIGTALGLWTFMLGVSSLISPVVGGVIVDITGSYVTALGFGVVAYLSALILAVVGLSAKLK